ncbi:MAG: thioredoxin [Pseudomonadota bacterium]
MAASEVSDNTFENDVLKSETPVLVDFWAEWCGPCKQISPALDEIAGEMPDKIKIAKINIDDNMDVPSRYGVRAIPTLMIFKDGELAATQVGVQTKSKLVNWIEETI